MQDSCQTDCNLAGQVSICRTEGIFCQNIIFFAKFHRTFVSQTVLKFLQDKMKKMPVLSGSPALFTKTGQFTYQLFMGSLSYLSG